MEPLKNVPPHSVPFTIRPPKRRPGIFRPLYKASPPQSVPTIKRPHHTASPAIKHPLYKASSTTEHPRNEASRFDNNIVAKSENYFIQILSDKFMINAEMSGYIFSCFHYLQLDFFILRVLERIQGGSGKRGRNPLPRGCKRESEHLLKKFHLCAKTK